MRTNIKTIELNISRTVEATPAEVFDVWIDKSSPGSPWFGVPKVILSPPKVDSLFYTMYQADGYEFANYGRFILLEKSRRIQYTWVSEATQGLESLVTVTLEPQGAKTVVQIKHANIPDDEGGRRYEHAHGYVLTRMSAHFKKGSKI